jgi:Ni,Fe-hydrogenase III small subunit/Pyruvate/2-oxoacid:ferredoxin oxidoreductase delta subunit
MLNILITRIRQKHRTIRYPAAPPTVPDRLRGLPTLDPSKCPPACQLCADACPTDAIRTDSPPGLRIDLGRCLFCNACTQACPTNAIRFTTDHRLATRSRDDLVLASQTLQRAQALDAKARQLFGRSLKLRQVSAGGCGGCEADVNVLSTIVFDLGRFGIQFVASPRHADGILITGAISQNMEAALRQTYDAVPAPKLVIAVGACAISGGPYLGNPEIHNGAEGLLPIDLYVPGCPPHPITILDGLLRLLGRLDPRGDSLAPVTTSPR